MLSVRADTPHLPWCDPSEATRLLRYALHRQGFTHTYQSNGRGMSVLSVLTDLTVWCKNGLFVWNEDGVQSSHPAEDPVGAARLISRHYRRPMPDDDLAVEEAGHRVRAFADTDSARD
ncbi:hypothetical protein OG884_25835 [Streptosporangium sp. NBC_01755]|uniref:hypothetical protein n=1 Tax=unclassified Streptosporangium TaxID=2632669 RepID=UPI002DD8B491|nr:MULTISPECIES: hypothetical protein [unclassified Streptosporangium]WSA23514.1 hypothetical protein OIE13_21395 [Streptosporangium sp. NBC_01810]WSC98277.1 hypothetical protein OG884_25835 [Streptosporangium sp. NBC_01755]